MEVQVKALDAFIHGPYNLTLGQRATMPETIARDLIRAGLVERSDGAAEASAADQKAAPAPSNKMLSEPENKVGSGLLTREEREAGPAKASPHPQPPGVADPTTAVGMGTGVVQRLTGGSAGSTASADDGGSAVGDGAASAAAGGSASDVGAVGAAGGAASVASGAGTANHTATAPKAGRAKA